MLTAKAILLDRKLEPTDNSVMEVTLRNTSKCDTAKNVAVTAKLRGGPCEGVELVPDDRSFGTIRPGKCVTKEFAINTERADAKSYEVLLLLEYESSHQTHECDAVCFDVQED